MRLPYSLALISLVACIDPPDAVPEALPPLETIERPCSGGGWGCGDNGPLVDGVPFWWVSLEGQINNGVKFDGPSNDVKFISATKHGNPILLDVENNVLRYLYRSPEWRYHDELVGVVIRLEIKGKRYDIYIDEVHYGRNGAEYWTEIPSGSAETYKLHWQDVVGGSRGPVCKSIVSFNSFTDTFTDDVLIFEGDHYDPETLAITNTPTEPEATSVFNIACKGSLPAKMALSRRTNATNPEYALKKPGLGGLIPGRDNDDRQALARAFAAEYCPGISFTHQGHKLRIRDRKRTLLHDPDLGWDDEEPYHYEAVWDRNGAVCLETPRLSIFDENFGKKSEKDVWTAVNRLCRSTRIPPRCSSQTWFPKQWRDHGDFLTAGVPSKLPRPSDLAAPAIAVANE